MTTIAELIDRTYRQVLEPPDAQPASTRLATFLNDTDASFVITAFDIPDDENLLRQGSILEMGRELVRVTDYTPSNSTVTALRGQLGTLAQEHSPNTTVKLSPPYPRIDVFNSVRDNIIALYPDLWTVKTEVLSQVAPGVFPIEDPLAVEIVEANPNSMGFGTVNLPARIVDNHPRVDGRAIVVNGAVQAGNIWFRYRRRFDTATSEADVLQDLGVEPVWEMVVLAGTAADTLAGRDVQASATDWVQSALETENIQVGTRLSLAGGLAQYRDILIERFAREMKGEDSNRTRVHFREVHA